MSGSEKKTVLVVDDDIDIRRFLSAALIEAGFEVMTANDGIDALQQIKKKPPDLISLDLVMPKKSGVKLYREMRKNSEWKIIPILIVTGHARDDLGGADLKELTMSGPGVYLEKPVKSDNYIAAVKKLLGMDTTIEETRTAQTVELQNEVKNMVDELDLETLRRIKEMLKGK